MIFFRYKAAKLKLREHFGNAVAGKKGKNQAVRRKSDRLQGGGSIQSMDGMFYSSGTIPL